ncbi:MAG TPA: hypothetical protein PLP17_16930 [Oligoflexia bacterium]|nr:hypothetical protein [Oligoflexia bacterium]
MGENNKATNRSLTASNFGEDVIAGQVSDANSCILLGAGVGALGAGAALAAGAVCPVCVVVSPALVGLGLVRRLQLRGKAAAIRVLKN